MGNCLYDRRTKRNTGYNRKSWIFLVLSGIATGLSWLFYYKALQLGDASKVVPIDKFSVVISMILAFVILKGLDIQDGYGRYSYNSRYFCNDSLIKNTCPHIIISYLLKGLILYGKCFKILLYFPSAA